MSTTYPGTSIPVVQNINLRDDLDAWMVRFQNDNRQYTKQFSFGDNMEAAFLKALSHRKMMSLIYGDRSTGIPNIGYQVKDSGGVEYEYLIVDWYIEGRRRQRYFNITLDGALTCARRAANLIHTTDTLNPPGDDLVETTTLLMAVIDHKRGER